MSAPRICLVSPTGEVGGGEVSFMVLIGALSGHRELEVVTFGEGELVDRLEAQGVTARVFERKGGLSDLWLIVRLVRFFRKHAIQLVHVNTLDIRAGIAARLAGCRLMGHLRVIFPFTWVDRTFVRLSQIVICVSAAVRAAFPIPDGCAERFEVVYNAVAAPSPDKAFDLRERLGIPPTSPIIGAVGRIDEWKGFETYIRAAARVAETMSDPHFVLIGRPGPREEEKTHESHLKSLVETDGLKERFHFVGYVPNAADFMPQFDILCVPSIELQTAAGLKTEGFGRVAAEGLAGRIPVIVSAVGGLSEIIEHDRSGLTVRGGDDAALAEAIDRILTDPESAMRLAAAGRARYEQMFTVDNHARRIEELYERLL